MATQHFDEGFLFFFLGMLFSSSTATSADALFSQEVIMSLMVLVELLALLGPFRPSLMSRRNTERFCVNLKRQEVVKIDVIWNFSEPVFTHLALSRAFLQIWYFSEPNLTNLALFRNNFHKFWYFSEPNLTILALYKMAWHPKKKKVLVNILKKSGSFYLGIWYQSFARTQHHWS